MLSNPEKKIKPLVPPKKHIYVVREKPLVPFRWSAEKLQLIDVSKIKKLPTDYPDEFKNFYLLILSRQIS